MPIYNCKRGLDFTNGEIQDSILVLPSDLLPSGGITISGYRHELNLIIPATIIDIGTTTTIFNVPDLEETKVIVEIIKLMGINISTKPGILTIHPSSFNTSEIPEQLSSLVHGALYLVPAILNQRGKCRLGQTGGCQIGYDGFSTRPIDHFPKIFKPFGVDCRIEQNNNIIAERKGSWQAATIDIMDFSCKTTMLCGSRVSSATKLAILLALNVKKEKTTILNPSLNAGVRGLLDFCHLLGYQISYDLNAIEINYQHSSKTPIAFSLSPDFSEFITFLVFSIINKVELTLYNIDITKLYKEIPYEMKLLSHIGCHLEEGHNTIHIAIQKKLKQADIEANINRFMTDNQPFISLLMAYSQGNSLIRDSVWKGRFDYVQHLNKLGYDFVIHTPYEVKVNNRISPIDAPTFCFKPHDLRSTAVTLLGAIAQKATCLIAGKSHLYRGYDNLLPKLRSLGANIIEDKRSIEKLK